MRKHFITNEWTEEDILSKIKALFQEHKEADYKIAVGHHPIAHLCGDSLGLAKILPLLKK